MNPATAEDSGPPAAGLGRRLVAMIYDALLLTAVLFGAAAAFLGLAAWLTGLEAAVRPGTPLHHPFQVFVLGVTYLYFAGFWLRAGHTPGMLTWKLALIREDGFALTHRDCLVRFCAATLSLAALGVGWLWILLDRDGLAWHDRLSGTRIVRRDASA